MAKPKSGPNTEIQSRALTRARAEKIAAIEGLSVTPRVARLLKQSRDLPGAERRAMVLAEFRKKSD